MSVIYPCFCDYRNQRFLNASFTKSGTLPAVIVPSCVVSEEFTVTQISAACSACPIIIDVDSIGLHVIDDQIACCFVDAVTQTVCGIGGIVGIVLRVEENTKTVVLETGSDRLKIRMMQDAIKENVTAREAKEAEKAEKLKARTQPKITKE